MTNLMGWLNLIVQLKLKKKLVLRLETLLLVLGPIMSKADLSMCTSMSEGSKVRTRAVT